jgi:hypothetical protein
VSEECEAANAYKVLATLHFAECRSLTIWKYRRSDTYKYSVCDEQKKDKYR